MAYPPISAIDVCTTPNSSPIFASPSVNAKLAYKSLLSTTISIRRPVKRFKTIPKTIFSRIPLKTTIKPKVLYRLNTNHIPQSSYSRSPKTQIRLFWSLIRPRNMLRPPRTTKTEVTMKLEYPTTKWVMKIIPTTAI